MQLELFHTSPEAITEITDDGRFGEFLFFSGRVYQMTAYQCAIYSIEIDDDSIIDAGQIFYHEDAAKLDELVAELAHMLSIDCDDAEALIEEKKSVFDFVDAEDVAEAGWDVQHFTARAAKMLGLRGVRVQDEQGAAYMIDMLGRESELKLIAK